MGPSGSATVEGLKNVSGGVVGYVTFLYKHFWAVGSIFQQNVHVFILQFSKRANNVTMLFGGGRKTNTISCISTLHRRAS